MASSNPQPHMIETSVMKSNHCPVVQAALINSYILPKFEHGLTGAFVEIDDKRNFFIQFSSGSSHLTSGLAVIVARQLGLITAITFD